MSTSIRTRREFLGNCALTTMGLALPQFLVHTAEAAVRGTGWEAGSPDPIPGFKDDRILVVIQLGEGTTVSIPLFRFRMMHISGLVRESPSVITHVFRSTRSRRSMPACAHCSHDSKKISSRLLRASAIQIQIDRTFAQWRSGIPHPIRTGMIMKDG